MNNYYLEVIYQNGKRVNVINPTVLHCTQDQAERFCHARQLASKAMGGNLSFAYELLANTKYRTEYINIRNAITESQIEDCIYEEIERANYTY